MSGSEQAAARQVTAEDAYDESTPNVPPKDRASSPDELLREEPLQVESEVSKSTSPALASPAIASSGVPPNAREEEGPPMPPRPMSQFDRDVATLMEAFPETDHAVVRAVLTASGGKVEPAFNALLGMSDPSFVAEETPPPQPPRPTAPRGDFQNTTDHYRPAANYNDPELSLHQTSTPLTQLEADELYARQLAQHYGGGTGGQDRGAPRRVRPERQQGDEYPQAGIDRTQRQRQNEPQNTEKERSFLEDDLPELTQNLKKGFFETQSKVNKWVFDLKKKIDGDDTADAETSQTSTSYSRTGPGVGRTPSTQQSYPQRQSSRPSGDNYDADPRVLEDDFSHLEMRDNTADNLQSRQTNRPLANPNLFGSTNSPNPRKVSFQNQSDEDLYRPPPNGKGLPTGTPPTSAMRTQSPSATHTTTPTTTTSKWAPLAVVDPMPENSDPFSLGDSDDEHEIPAVAGGVTKTGSQETGTVGGATPPPGKIESPK